jgi:hypothetical protein
MVVAVVAGVALLALAMGYLVSRRRRNRRQAASSSPDAAIRMDIPDEEFWRWRPRRADDRRVSPRTRRGILRRRVHSSS